MQALLNQLESGLQKLSLDLSIQQQDSLIAFIHLIEKWNRSYNLTAVNKLDEMVSLHLLDSLSVIPFIEGESFIDVGTGAGLPGVPLAITFPQCQFTLLDTNGKRTRFLLQAKAELGLDNIQVLKTRAESYQPEKKFDGVFSRAFTSLSDMLQHTQQLCAENGSFYAMKGLYPEKELRELPKGFKVKGSHRLSVPGVEGERHLVVIQSDQYQSP